MVQKIKGYFRHIWLKTTSKKYRRQLLLEKGEQLWNKLDGELLPAFGVIKDDKARLKQFKSRVELMSEQNRDALKLFLKKQVKLFNGSEFVMTYREEEAERKMRQIFSTHLEIVENTYLTHLLKDEE